MNMVAAQMVARPAIMQRSWKSFYWLLATLALLTSQLCCGTQPAFAALVALFCLLTYYTVMAAGGVMSLVGITIFFLALQNVLISQFAKVFLGQPADSFLIQPLVTMGVYDAGMFGMLAAALLFRRSHFSRRPPLFAPEVDPARLFWIALFSTIFYLVQAFFLHTGHTDAETGKLSTGGVSGLFSAMPFVFPLAVASGTAYTIVASRGRRSVGVLNLIAVTAILVAGISGANREALPDAAGIYFLTCFAFRFRFRWIHLAVVLAGVYLAQYIFFPYALYARNFVRTPDVQKNLQMAASTFVDVLSDPVKYQQMQYKVSKDSTFKFYYYGKPLPTLDRFSQISIADAVIDVSLRLPNSEMDTITPGFLDIPPRFLLPDKPLFSTNTMIAHRVAGMVGKRDFGTGISMGFFCDAFASFSWPGAFCIPFLLTFAFFCAYSLLISLRLWQNIYALCFVLSMPHIFSEGVISSQIVFMLQTPFVFVIVTYTMLFLVSIAMRAQVRIQEAKYRAARIGRRRLVSRRLN